MAQEVDYDRYNSHDSMKTETARQGQVSEQLACLEEAVEMLANTVGCVDDRLGPVLRVLDGDENKAAVDETLVPLADQIGTLAARVRRQTERLARILERLEL